MKHQIILLAILTKINLLFSFAPTINPKYAINLKGRKKFENDCLQASSMSHGINRATHNHKPALMGKLSYLLSTLAINPRKFRAIKAALNKEVIVVDIIALLFFNCFLKPTSKAIYHRLLHKKDYDKSNVSTVADLSSQFSKIASLVYAIDIL